MEQHVPLFREGQIIEGEVTIITPFGVFVEFAEEPDYRGLCHISEMADGNLSAVNPNAIFQLHERRKFKVLETDPRIEKTRRRISDLEKLGKFPVDLSIIGLEE